LAYTKPIMLITRNIKNGNMSLFIIVFMGIL